MPVHNSDRHLRILLALVVALVGCAEDDSSTTMRAAAIPDSTHAPRATVTSEAGGEVAADSSAPTVKWLTDANVIALVGAMNTKQLAAADAELSSWHVESVRAFAAQMAREHSALQRSVDSAAAALRIAPVTPALGPLLRARMQAQIDSIYHHGGRAFDRAYVDQQVASHQLMYLYLARLSAVAENDAVRQVLSAVADSAQSQLTRALALRATFASADSAAADSAARKAARRAARLNREADR